MEPIDSPGQMKSLPLNPRQQRFVDEYLVDLHGTKAAIRAGYSERSAGVHSARLLADDRIQAAVAEKRKRLEIKSEITVQKVLKEYGLIAFADMADYLRFDEDGQVHLDWSAMPAEATKAIAEVVQEEFTDGTGRSARPIRRTRFKLHNKTSALDSIAKHLGMFIDRHRHEGEINIGGVLVVPGTTENSDEWDQIAETTQKNIAGTNGHG